jgi:hypothetical protein
MQSQIDAVLDLERVSLGHVLTIGQASLPDAQFQCFKKLVMDHFHSVHKPMLLTLLKNCDDHRMM